ncbi:MAG: hypothetical protein AAGJ70_08910, partial [Pseudomonadota bacterium]
MSSRIPSRPSAAKPQAKKPARPQLRETDLYPAVKQLLEQQGYKVKGEVANADVVGIKDGDAPIVV